MCIRDRAKTEHAAAEVSEGGIFTPKNREKPSVLGKLSVAKTQEKTPTAPGTAMKKKEDVYKRQDQIRASVFR